MGLGVRTRHCSFKIARKCKDWRSGGFSFRERSCPPDRDPCPELPTRTSPARNSPALMAPGSTLHLEHPSPGPCPNAPPHPEPSLTVKHRLLHQIRLRPRWSASYRRAYQLVDRLQIPRRERRVLPLLTLTILLIRLADLLIHHPGLYNPIRAAQEEALYIDVFRKSYLEHQRMLERYGRSTADTLVLQAIEQSLRIPLNQATLDEMMTLPGVGEATARRILEWREQNGGFERLEDLTRVKGIGSKTLERLRPHLTLEDQE